LNFVSAIPLQFNDLFSAGFARAHESVTGLQGSLEGINATGLTGLQRNLTGLDNAVTGLNQPLGEVKTNLSGVNTALEGINPANLNGFGVAAAALG
jgi:hypothetical protein